MNRRQVMSLGGFGILTAVSGCTWVTGADIPAGMSVETRHYDTRILAFHHPERPEEHQRPDAPEKDRNPYTQILTTESGAKDRLVHHDRSQVDNAKEFIRATDFGRSYLVLTDWEAASSSFSLVLDSVRRTGDDLHLDIWLNESTSATADASVHTLAVRITDESGTVPESAAANVHESAITRWVPRLEK